MMIPEFNDLTDSESELVFKAPILVTMLIAGADGKIDNKEIKQSISVMTKAEKLNPLLASYFTVLSEDIEDKIKILIQSYPADSTQRTSTIVEELTSLNAVFSKLDSSFTLELYNTLRSLAQKVAASSGGLLGINSVTDEEQKYIDLPMIHPPS